MAVRGDWTPNEVLKADDLNDTFAAKLDVAVGAGGKILQIVRATDTTDRTTTSTSYIDVTGMSVTITPQKDTSAILVIASFNADTYRSNAVAESFFQLSDASDNALSGAEGTHFNIGTTGPTAVRIRMQQILWAYVTPATTSAVTYKLRFVSSSGVTTTVLNAATTGQIYAIEVSA